ncbi:hypothetical protein [Spirochaeta dissipatitropha]
MNNNDTHNINEALHRLKDRMEEIKEKGIENLVEERRERKYREEHNNMFTGHDYERK